MADSDSRPCADEDLLAIISRLEDLVELLRSRLEHPCPCRFQQGGPHRRLQCGSIQLDLSRLRVTDCGTPVALTPREALVLAYLLERPDQVVTREQLLVQVWGYRYAGDARTVDVHICRLRRKLPALRGHLLTLKHIGYRLASADDSAPSTPVPGDHREPASGPRTPARRMVIRHAVRGARVAGS